MLSTICWSFVQRGIWIKQRVASLPMCWQPAHRPSRWWSRLEGPKRDMEKIEFRLWIHKKKMWSCTFFKTAIYTRWEINMIFDWYLILFPVCFWDPLIYLYQFHYFTMISTYNITPEDVKQVPLVWPPLAFVHLMGHQSLAGTFGLKILLPVWDRCLESYFHQTFQVPKM